MNQLYILRQQDHHHKTLTQIKDKNMKFKKIKSEPALHIAPAGSSPAETSTQIDISRVNSHWPDV